MENKDFWQKQEEDLIVGWSMGLPDPSLISASRV
jgi:hypothetical protein